MKRNALWIAALAVTVVAASFVSVNAAARLAAKPSAVAIADVQRIFDNLAEKVQVEADMQSLGERTKQEHDNKQRELQLLKGDLDLLAPGTPAYEQKREELESQAIQLQAWMAFQQKKITRDRVANIERLYSHTLDAIDRVAQENGYDLVLFKEQNVNFSNVKPEQLSAVIQVRKVLYSAPEMDITESVITRMNNEFKNAN